MNDLLSWRADRLTLLFGGLTDRLSSDLCRLILWLNEWLTGLIDWLCCWGAYWLIIIGLVQANSLTKWRTYQLTLLPGGWEVNTLVTLFSTHWLAVLGLIDQLIASQKDWLADSTVWWLSNGHWLNESEQTYWLPKDLLANSLSSLMTYWLSLLSRN